MAVRALPEIAARTAFDAGARYAARNGGPDQLRKNLARILGVPPAEVPDTLMRASLASYGRYWREAFRLPTMNHRELARQLNERSGAGQSGTGHRRWPRSCVRVAAQRQLGHGRDVDGADARHLQHRRGTT